MNKMKSSTNRNHQKKKKDILDLKNTMTELKNSIENFKSRLDHAE